MGKLVDAKGKYKSNLIRLPNHLVAIKIHKKELVNLDILALENLVMTNNETGDIIEDFIFVQGRPNKFFLDIDKNANTVIINQLISELNRTIDDTRLAVSYIACSHHYGKYRIYTNIILDLNQCILLSNHLKSTIQCDIDTSVYCNN